MKAYGRERFELRLESRFRARSCVGSAGAMTFKLECVYVLGEYVDFLTGMQAHVMFRRLILLCALLKWIYPGPNILVALVTFSFYE